MRGALFLCRAYGAEIGFAIDPQPCRAGLTFAVCPPGLESVAVPQSHFFSAASGIAGCFVGVDKRTTVPSAPTRRGRRDDNGAAELASVTGTQG